MIGYEDSRNDEGDAQHEPQLPDGEFSTHLQRAGHAGELGITRGTERGSFRCQNQKCSERWQWREAVDVQHIAVKIQDGSKGRDLSASRRSFARARLTARKRSKSQWRKVTWTDEFTKSTRGAAGTGRHDNVKSAKHARIQY